MNSPYPLSPPRIIKLIQQRHRAGYEVVRQYVYNTLRKYIVKQDPNAWLNTPAKRERQTVFTPLVALNLSDILREFSLSDMSQYNNQFYDQTITDEKTQKLIQYCLKLREGYDILPHPKRLSMPERMQNLIHSHIANTSAHQSQYVYNEQWEQFMLSDEELYQPQFTCHHGLEKELSQRLPFSNLHRTEGNDSGLPINGRHSVNLQIKLPAGILDPLLAEIDPDLLPRATDSKEDLISRNAASSYLDEIHSNYPAPRKNARARRIFKGFRATKATRNHNNLPWKMTNKEGSSLPPGLTRQNASNWTQPKRRSTSVVVNDVHVYSGTDGEGQGKDVMTLYNYTSFGRNADDWRGRPMKMVTFNFSLYVWMVCWPYLTKQSRKTPPTHCQLLFYYRRLNSHINQHRDNFDVEDIKRVMKGDANTVQEGHPSAGADNSQIVGSNVLVYSEGTAAQTLYLRFPKRDDLLEDRKLYKCNPSFQFECGKGTVSILDPIDDYLMTHEARFDAEVIDKNGYRLGYCLRWLSSAKDFYVETCGMRLDSKALQVLKDRERWLRADELFPEHCRKITT